MLSILVENQELALTEDISFELHDANPFFTKDGAYTYDIDVDLSIGQNNRIYNHIDRINCNVEFTGRKVVVMDGAKVLLEGTETLLEMDGDILKIQIVAGNSDLNFCAKGKSVSDLDLGEFPEITVEWAMDSLYNRFPDFNGVCCPILTAFKEFPRVGSSGVDIANFIFQNTYNSRYFVDGTKFYVQPYLVYVVEKVLEALGWTVKYNVLREDERTCRMIVVHAFDTLRLSEMLPNWKVSDFLSEVEAFFNVVFICENTSRTVSIYSYQDYYENQSDLVEIDSGNIVKLDGSPSRKYDVSESYVYNYDKIKYDFPSVWKYQYADLSDDIMRIVEVKEFSYFEDFDTEEFKSSAYFNQPYLFYDRSVDEYYVLSDTRRTSGGGYHWEPVNIFAHLDFKSDDESGVVFKICPAEVLAVNLHPDIDGPKLMGAAVPFARNQVTLKQEATSDNGLTDWIVNGPPEQYDSSSNPLFVAYYVGWCNVLHAGDSQNPDLQEIYNGTYYPQCVTTPYIMQFYDISGQSGDRFNRVRILRDRSDWQWFDFNLRWRYIMFYSKNIKVDTSVEYEFDILETRDLDVRSLFLISNKMFYCKELVYRYEKGTRLPYITGVFYPVK